MMSLGFFTGYIQEAKDRNEPVDGAALTQQSLELARTEVMKSINGEGI